MKLNFYINNRPASIIKLNRKVQPVVDPFGGTNHGGFSSTNGAGNWVEWTLSYAEHWGCTDLMDLYIKCSGMDLPTWEEPYHRALLVLHGMGVSLENDPRELKLFCLEFSRANSQNNFHANVVHYSFEDAMKHLARIDHEYYHISRLQNKSVHPLQEGTSWNTY